MKKLFVLLLALCLLLGISTSALAAGKPKITEQPESAVTDEKGTVSFSVKASNIEGLTWRFVDPETGEETTGKKLPKKFKGLKVEGANKKTIKLKNVPEEMHGWTVYCHITGGNGYQVDSDRVTLLVYGMGDPATSDTDTGDTGTEPDTNPDEGITEVDVTNPDEGITEVDVTNPSETDNTQSDSTGTPDESTGTPDESAGTPDETVATPVEEIPENTVFTIRGENVTLYPVDAYGNRLDEEASDMLTFEGNTNVAVQSNGEVKYWVINGMRVEPAGSGFLPGFTLRNVTTNLTITAVVDGGSVTEEEGNTVQITCEGCTFTYGKGNLKNVSEGQVPAGAAIIIVADGNASGGYSINGGNFEHVGEASFRLVVSGDTVIKTK